MRNKSLVLLIIILVFLVGGCSPRGGGGSGQAVEERPEVGYLAPDFTLTDMAGEELQLSSFRGEKVLLNFWTTWCPHCVEELPHLDAVHRDGVITVVTVNLTYGERSLNQVEQFLQMTKYSFYTGLDLDGAAGQAYGVRSIPANYFIDEEGVIRERLIRPLDREEIEGIVDQMKVE